MASETETNEQLQIELEDTRRHFADLKHKHKKLRDGLREAEEQYRALLKAAPVGVLMVNAEGRIETVNERIEAQFGYRREELVGEPLSILLPERYHDVHGAQVGAFMFNPQARVMGSGLDLVGQRKDGSEFPLEVGLGHIGGHREKLAVAFVTDITERKKTEQQIFGLALEREQAKLFQIFTQDLAHDFGTPLSIITSSLYLVEKLKDPGKRQMHMDLIRTQTDRIMALVENLTKMTQLDGTGVDFFFVPVDLNDVVQVVLAKLSTLTKTKQLRVRVDLDGKLPAVKADQYEITRALVNLVENGVKYSPAGGTLEIRTYGSKGDVVVEVSDKGMGIPVAELPHVFDPFFRGKGSERVHSVGRGLGLSVTKKIVEIHQGTVVVESVVGQGSTFRVLLPAVRGDD